MHEIKKRISYLQGLAEGMNIGTETKEGRILTEMINILGDMAEDMEEIVISQAEVEEYIEVMDDDLNDLEEDVYEGEVYETPDDESEYYYDDEISDEIDDEDGIIGDIIEMECPKCQEEVFFESEILEDDDVVEVICPSCDEVIFMNDQNAIENSQMPMVSRDTEDI